MATCPSCGTRYGDNQRLCPHDGAVLELDQAPESALVGRVLDGKYRLDAYLSRGGMGAVYEATHVMLNRKVAVKVISPALVSSQDMVRRFQREARAVTHLNHPNIVRVHDLGQTADGSLYIAMDLIAGQSLGAIMERTGTFEPPRIVHVLSQIVSALAHAHAQGIVHRDLKPQNIMIGRDKNGQEAATLLDFGIAKTFEVDAHTQVTSTGFAVGTPHYMSPEQAGAAPVDARSDLYSVGVILYQMLAGVVPFDDSSTPVILVKHLQETPVRPSVKRPDLLVSPQLERIAMRCLEKNPDARFQSADELLNALAGSVKAREASPTMPVTARRPTTIPPAATPAATPKLRWKSFAAVAVVVALVSAGIAAIVARRAASNVAPQTAPTQQATLTDAPPQAQPPAPATTATPETTPAEPSKPPPPKVVQPRPQQDSPAVTEAATEPPQRDAATGRSPWSRALTQRVRTLLAQRNIPVRRFQGANLEVAVRRSAMRRGITADYVATVRTAAGERSFSGSHSALSELALRRDLIEKAAADIVTYLATLP